MIPSTFPRRIRRRFERAILNLDVEAAKQLAAEHVTLGGFTPSSDRVVLAGLHKARAELPSASAEQRLESLEWLRRNGFRAFGGKPAGMH
jgi:hypothetical protein